MHAAALDSLKFESHRLHLGREALRRCAAAHLPRHARTRCQSPHSDADIFGHEKSVVVRQQANLDAHVVNRLEDVLQEQGKRLH